MDGDAPVGSGGPAPFLLKTFEMVDDASTNDIVSWSSTNISFVVWNPPDFAARLLPTYFKHNNFSSFIRQLNTYGFRKIDPERWEFANEDFIKGQKHLLKNIYRRKPIHSHSHPPGGCHADAERMALEDEVERLNKEKSSLEANLLKFKQQQSGTGIQLEFLERRLLDMEQRQLKMIAFVQQAMQNPRLLESLVKMATTLSIDASVINKKRRLPSDVNHGQEVSGNNLCDDHSSTNKPEIGYILDQDFCDKLRLGLCSAIPDDGLVIIGTQSSNEDNCISQIKQTDSVQGRMECLPLVPEILEPCEAGLSICQSKNDLLARAVDGNTLFPCQLSLTLASSAVEIDCGKNYIGTSDLLDQGTDTNSNYMIAAAAPNLTVCDTERGNDLNIPVRCVQDVSINPVEAKAVSTQETGSICNETPTIPSGGVNDVFWQQFLTERPGSIEVEEANSLLGANAFDYQNKEKVPRSENKGVSEEIMEDLKL